jgi:hypothetical protein
LAECREANISYSKPMKINFSKSFIRVSRLALVMAIVCLSMAASLAAEQTNVVFDGKDLNGWRKPTGTWMPVRSVALDHAAPEHFIVTQGTGVLLNNPTNHSVDLVSDAEFGDVEMHVEFCVARHSNSGIYLMGRYELQIFDSYGIANDKYPGIECGGFYPRWVNGGETDGHSPKVNASKPAGSWQSYDITFRAPRFDASGKKIANAKAVKIVQNGKVIQENLELNGPTRGPMAEDEKPKGPIRLQGDHGPVAFRNIRIKEVNLD